MTVIVLQVFVSLMLVIGSVVLFVFTVRSRTFEHSDRLSLAPLEDDARPASAVPSPSPSTVVIPATPARAARESAPHVHPTN